MGTKRRALTRVLKNFRHAQIEDEEGEFSYDDFYESLDEKEEEELKRRVQELEKQEDEFEERERLQDEDQIPDDDSFPDEQMEAFETIAEDPSSDLHKYYYENSAKYRKYFDSLGLQLPEKTSEEEIIKEVEEEAVKQAEESEEEVFQRLNETFDGMIEYKAQLLNLTEDEARELLEAEKRRTPEEKEEEEVLLNPADLVKVANPYKELKDRHLNIWRSKLKIYSHGDEVEAEKLGRAFFGYIPASLLREYYGIGLKSIDANNKTARLQEQERDLRIFDKNLDIHLESKNLEKLSKDEKQELKIRVEKLVETREQLGALIKDIDKALIVVDSNVKASRFQVAIKYFNPIVLNLVRKLEQFRRELPQNTEYGSLLDDVASTLNGVLIDLQDFLSDPEAVRRPLASSFLDWHNLYGKGNKRFDQLYAMIIDYTESRARTILARMPFLKNTPGVQGLSPTEEAQNLVTAMLYGINLQHAETARESDIASNRTELDQYLDNPELLQQQLNQLPNERIKQEFLRKIERQRKYRQDIDTSTSILHRIHKHITQTGRSQSVCPICRSSWWSFQSEAFPNASSEVFDANIKPRVVGKTPEMLNYAKNVRDNLLYEWRENPFNAPHGIYLRNEGQFCGGIFAGADVDTIIEKISNAADELEEERKRKQKQLNDIIENEEESIPEDLFAGPFDLEAMKKTGKVWFNEDKIAKIVLPDTTVQEVEKNCRSIREAYEKGKKTPEFSYKDKEYIVSKEQFVKLKQELDGQLCFHPRTATQESLAQVITKAVYGAARKLADILPRYAKEQRVDWTCPECGSINKTPVDIAVLARGAKKGIGLNSYSVNCDNPDCPQPFHMLGEVERQSRSQFYALHGKSIDYKIDEESGTLGETLEAPNVNEEVLYEIDEVEEERKKEKALFIKELNFFGAENSWKIKPSTKSRFKIEISLPNLGETIFSTISDVDYKELIRAFGKSDARSVLSTLDQDMMTIANKLGLIFPFSVCRSCGTLHPSPAIGGELHRCVHVENTGLVKTMNMNEVLNLFKEIKKTKPKYPDVHIPDFEGWIERWKQQFKKAKLIGFKRYAIDEDEEDFSLLGKEGELFKEEEEDFIENPFESILNDIPSEPGEQPPSFDFSMDDLLEATFDTEKNQDEVDQVKEDTKSPEIDDVKGKDLSTEDLLEQYSLGEQQQTFGFEKKFESQTLEDAFKVLPVSEREKIWGSDMMTFNSGSEVNKIPADVLALIKEKYGIEKIVALVDSPIEVVNVILDEAKNHLIKVVKDLELD